MLIEDYMKKALVKKIDKAYYLVIDGKKERLDQDKIKANSLLSEMLKSGKVKSIEQIENSPQETLDLPEPEEETNKEEPLNQEFKLAPFNKASNEEDELSQLLGTIVDIKPSGDYVDTDIFYKDVNVNLVNNPVIKALPVVFRWRTRGTGNANIIDDGNGNLTCNNWQVLMKDRHHVIYKHLKFSRNETPNSPYVTNGDLVLCIAKKSTYEERQRNKALSGLIQAKKDKEKRLKLGQDVRLINDADKQLDILESQNNKDAQSMNDYDKQLQDLKNNL